MLTLWMLCAVLALTHAVDDVHKPHCCTLEDRHEVLSLWETVWSAEYTGRRVAIAKAAFAR